MTRKNVKTGWKTTIIGIVLLAASVASVFLVDGINWLDASIGVALGIGMLFTPDDIIRRIGQFFKKKTETNEVP